MADRRRRFRRATHVRRGLLAGLLLALGISSVARADPAGPTDYRSEIVAVEPAAPGVDVSIVGGDAFVRLRVEPGTEVIVVGYQDEDYLWFRDDGAVLENRRSPSTYLNTDRFAGSVPPPEATADAEPDWRQVAAGGDFSWHDHRSHWMQTSRPVGFGPGDVILESTIPLRVDGQPVDVHLTSTWLPAPSPVPAWVGAAIGLAAAGVAVALQRASRSALWAALPLSVAAVTIGAWQYWSLPASTGPRVVWIALPFVALACTLAGLVAPRFVRAQPALRPLVAHGALLVVGAELAVWGFVRRDGLGAAIIPTGAPFWLDRLVTAATMTAGATFSVLALWWLFGGTAPRSAQRSQGADGLAAPGPPVSTS